MKEGMILNQDLINELNNSIHQFVLDHIYGVITPFAYKNISKSKLMVWLNNFKALCDVYKLDSNVSEKLIHDMYAVLKIYQIKMACCDIYNNVDFYKFVSTAKYEIADNWKYQVNELLNQEKTRCKRLCQNV